MVETRTRLHAAMPAERRASSNDVSFSRCLPTPFVKNISLGTNPTTSRSFSTGDCMVNTKFPTVNSVRALRGGRYADLTLAAGRDNLAHLTIRGHAVNRTQARDTA